MAFQVVWTDAALADLKEILEYLSGKNEQAATRIGNAILDHVEILESFPRIGVRYPKNPRRGYREIMCENYRIFYRIDEALRKVEILSVRHGSRQDPVLN